MCDEASDRHAVYCSTDKNARWYCHSYGAYIKLIVMQELLLTCTNRSFADA